MSLFLTVLVVILSLMIVCVVKYIQRPKKAEEVHDQAFHQNSVAPQLDGDIDSRTQ